MHPLSPYRGARPAAVASAALLCAALLGGCATAPGSAHSPAAPATGPVAPGTAGVTPVAAVSALPSNAAAGSGRSSVVGLRGTLYYVDARITAPDRLVRLTRSGPVTVLRRDGISANVSPNGRRIAYLRGSTVLVADRNGRHPRVVLRNAVPHGYEPTWSPDSARLLVVRGPETRPTPGVVNLRTGRFTRLPGNPRGIHYQWSADGRHIGFATGGCRLGVADRNGRRIRTVPVIGDPDRRTNPRGLSSCDPFSISPDGSRMAVALVGAGQPNGDIGRDLVANAVVDTRTGAVARLRVTGRVTAVLFQSDGTVLVRTRVRDHYRLTLLSRRNAVLATVVEPRSVRRLALLGYVRT